MKNKTVIILCPTFCRAVHEWKRLARLPLWTKINKSQLTLVSVFGNTWKFVGGTEEQQELRGHRAEIISNVDDFIIPEGISELIKEAEHYENN